MDIQPSTLKSLSVRVAKRNYQKYLVEIHLRNVRAFSDQKITFSFPVTALIGTNGGGSLLSLVHLLWPISPFGLETIFQNRMSAIRQWRTGVSTTTFLTVLL